MANQLALSLCTQYSSCISSDIFHTFQSNNMTQVNHSNTVEGSNLGGASALKIK